MNIHTRIYIYTLITIKKNDDRQQSSYLDRMEE
jgi:hypothetical protein